MTYGGLRMRHSRSEFAAVLLAVLVGIEAVLYVQLHISHRSLSSAYDRIEGEFSSLQGLYGELDAAHRSLNASYLDLQASYDSLQYQYDLLQQTHTELLEEIDMERALRIGNSLESFFDLVREEEVPAIWQSYQAKADFGARLALHGLGINCWPSLEDAYYEVAGKHSYESARERIDYVTEVIGVSAYDSPTEKIRKILDFASDSISFEEEIDEVFLAPAETLAFKSGDCDDFSILAACFFEALGIDAAFGIFRNSDATYHCMVLVYLDGLEGYKYLAFSDLTRFGLDRGKWIVIEPQYPISRQDLEWIGQWYLVVATPLDVSK